MPLGLESRLKSLMKDSYSEPATKPLSKDEKAKLLAEMKLAPQWVPNVPKDLPERDGYIKTGSISRLTDYEGCPRRAMFKYVDKIPEPPRNLDGKEPANLRGDRVHNQCEAYIHGKIPEPPKEARHFIAELQQARLLWSAQRAATEEWWLYDRGWQVLEPKQPKSSMPPEQAYHPDTCFRSRTDLRVWVDPDYRHLLIVDYKTGARFGNEIKHAGQMNSYIVSGFLRYPTAMKVTTELWYLDHNELVSMTCHRHQFQGFHANLERRYSVMFADRVFRPKPSHHACRFCPYKTGLIGKGPDRGTGHCRLNP